MRLALAQAQLARAAGEVPVGAVVVADGQLVGAGYNQPISLHDPSAHAEMQALRAAAQRLGNYRLDNCTLYVTLEPCSMCAGAMLHARLKRVVFGAPDPKTGAAGSVLNLLALPQLNHQTQLTGGVLADSCAQLLQDFFQHQRAQQARQQAGRALRDDALRTPEQRFASLAALPATDCYLNDLPSLAGLRLHYLDTLNTAEHNVSANKAALPVLVYLHGLRDWSVAWRSHLAQAQMSGHRVLCPDLIGFGKSDKPKKNAWHSLAQHAQILHEWIERLGLAPVHLRIAPDNWLLAHQWAALAPDDISAIDLAQPDPLDSAARDAPYPDQGHRAAWLAFSPHSAPA